MTIGNVIPSRPPGSAVLILFSHCFLITSGADSRKNKKKAVNDTSVLPLASLGSRWYLLVFDNYSWGKPSSLACFQVERQRWFLLYVGLLWLSSSCSWNIFESGLTCLINCKIQAGYTPFSFVLLLQISFKALLNQLGCACVFSQVSLLEKGVFYFMLRWRWILCVVWVVLAGSVDSLWSF